MRILRGAGLNQKKQQLKGQKMERFVIYIHGKGGNADEAEHYKPLFPDWNVIGFDYHSQTPWEAREEFAAFFDSYRKKNASIVLIANSIGAFLALCSLTDRQLERALLISPIVDMEKLIVDMMRWANISEAALREKKEIATEFGEVLSWEYLCYVREHPVKWSVPTCILYGERDHMTAYETVSKFANQIGAELSVMPGGEHWFHTEEQMRFLDDWAKKSFSSKICE